MKIQKTTFTVIVLTIFLISTNSCKNNVNGCSDPSSDNYNFESSSAEGSCNYHGNLKVWYDSTTYDSLLTNNIATVNILVDSDSFQTMIPPFILWSTEPNCSTSEIGNWITMTGTKTRVISLRIEAMNGNAVIRQWDETITVEANQCELYKITWQ